jgi:hypothetical protein
MFDFAIEKIGGMVQPNVPQTNNAKANGSHTPSISHRNPGAQANLVLTLPGGKLWAIEIKRSSAPSIGPGFHLACADLKPSKRFIVYPGSERFPLNLDTDVIGLSELGRALQEAK